MPAPLTKGSVVASDAFFPFADGLLVAIEAGATAVIQPGGSMRDDEVIKAADDARHRHGVHRHAAFPALRRRRGRVVTRHPAGMLGSSRCTTSLLARSPSRLAATVSFDSVSPEPAISWIAARMRSTSALRGATQASTAAAPAAPFADHRRR